MTYHSCYATPVEGLDVIVVDDSKPMQAILRSMLHALKVRRIRVFDGAEEALQSMVREPPNLILTDWRMGKVGGFQFLNMLRARFMEPLCYVPVIVVTAHATRRVVDRAMKAGAHLLLVKPVSPTVLVDHIKWLLSDSRQFILGANGAYEIEGVAEKLRLQEDRSKAITKAAKRPVKPASAKKSPGKRQNQESPGPANTPENWAAFLKAKDVPAAPGVVKPPEKTLQGMPRLKHFAALRDQA